MWKVESGKWNERQRHNGNSGCHSAETEFLAESMKIAGVARSIIPHSTFNFAVKKRRFKMKKLLAVLVLLVFAVPFVFAARLVSLETFNIKLDAKNADAVGTAIVEGCKAARKWTVNKKTATEVIATFSDRQFVIVVSITYNKEGYTITHKSSENLNYDAKKKQIHPSYSRWVGNLSTAIQNKFYTAQSYVE